MHYIAHAGAAAVDWRGSRYTDALSTMEYQYNKGFRLFEMDLLYSVDKQQQVCSHGWKHYENSPELRRFVKSDVSDLYDPEFFPSYDEITASRHNEYLQYSDGCN